MCVCVCVCVCVYFVVSKYYRLKLTEKIHFLKMRPRMHAGLNHSLFSFVLSSSLTKTFLFIFYFKNVFCHILKLGTQASSTSPRTNRMYYFL